MFDHEYFDHYEFDEVPQGTDLYLMDERDIADYELLRQK